MEGQTNIVSIRWFQTGHLSEISLTGPFGVSVAEIQSDGDELIIKTSEGETRYRDEIALSGPWTDSVKLPWRSLAYWVRGVTGPGGTALKDEYRAEDWLIRVLRRDDLGPRLVVIEHPGASLRLKVREWQFGGRKVPDQ
jgi:outer membrane biogenesis lipoprotein LolB